jgi:hexokinase
MLSGMYLGEIARLIFNKLVHSGLLFSGVNAPCLNKPYAFLTDYMSEIERFAPTTRIQAYISMVTYKQTFLLCSDSSAELSGVKALLGRINIPQSTLDERRVRPQIPS